MFVAISPFFAVTAPSTVVKGEFSMTTKRSTNALLGYPDEARLLIINADDFGMCHANVEATFRSLTEGVVTSTTLMVPCPWSPLAMQLLRANSEIAFGVHLTLIAEHSTYRWGPVASRDRVASLLDEDGYFFLNSRSAEMLAGAKIDEVEIEYRAQIDTVVQSGLSPTHLDWHCLYDGGRPDITKLTQNLAREYGLAMRAHGEFAADLILSQGLPANDHGVLDSYSMVSKGKSDMYVELLHLLPAGLTEWAVHPGLGNAESVAMEPIGWDVRKADYDFVTSTTARDVINEEGIILLNYRPLQQRWNGQG